MYYVHVPFKSRNNKNKEKNAVSSKNLSCVKAIQRESNIKMNTFKTCLKINHLFFLRCGVLWHQRMTTDAFILCCFASIN